MWHVQQSTHQNGLIISAMYAGKASQQIQHVVDTTLPILLHAFDTDDDKESVMAAVLGCGPILQGAGAQACQKHMEPMATGCSMVRS